MARAELSRLRRTIAEIEGRLAEEDRLPDGVAKGGEGGRLPLRIPSLDGLLGGGLPLATLHEIRAAQSRDGAAAAGFALALLAGLAGRKQRSPVVWVGEESARRETGSLYAPGLAALGLDPAAVLEVSVETQREALWALEAALSASGIKAAVCELRQASLDLSATRRCVLRARARGVTGFLLRLGNEWVEPSAAELRFAVSPAPAGVIGGFAAGVGRMAWRVELEKNRFGPTGGFTVEWNAHERRLVERGEGDSLTHPESVPAAAPDRPSPADAAERDAADRAAFRRAS